MEKNEKKAVSLLKEQVKQAHKSLNSIMSDVTPEQAHWIPPGTANPLGATYAHLILSEDAIINGLLQKKEPLQGKLKEKTGLSEPMPMFGPEWTKYRHWTRNVKINKDDLMGFADKVYRETEDYISSLTDEDLDKEIDLTDTGMGKVPLRHVLSTFIIEHAGNITGEIAVLKGIQGMTGYGY